MKQKQDSKNKMLVRRAPAQMAEPLAVEYRQPLNGSNGHSEDKAHLQEFLFSLRKYWLLIAGLTLLCTALMAVYMARQPNLYEANVQIQVDLENPSPTLGTDQGWHIRR